MNMQQVTLFLLVGSGLYFIYQGVYAIRYQQNYRRNWLTEKLLRRASQPMEAGMVRAQGVLRLIYGVVLLGMALYFWRVGG